MRRPRRRMRRTQDQVRTARPQPRHVRRLALRVAAPQDEDLGRRVGGDRRDRGVGEALPPLALMRRGHSRLDRQAIVEQQHALFGPMPVTRSEEHTSELQSLMRISYAVFCLKKKNNTERTINVIQVQKYTTYRLMD